MSTTQTKTPVQALQINTPLYTIINKFKEHPLTALLTAERSKIAERPINYLDVEVRNKEPYFSFLPAKKKCVAGETLYQAKARQSGRAGRIIKKLFPTVSDDDVRTFVDHLKADLTTELEVNLLPATEVFNVYNMKAVTNLGSCFQSNGHNRQPEENFEFFKNNPEVVNILAVTKGDTLEGRCLVWIDEAGNKYADRIYATPTAKLLIDGFLKEHRIANSPFGLKVKVNNGKKFPYFDRVSFSGTGDNYVITGGRY